MRKSFKLLVATGAVGASLLFSGAAHAVATQTVLGVTFPVGLLAGGNQIDTALFGESLVTAAGQTSAGVGVVQSINTTTFLPTWANGQNGVELVFVFDNYVATSVTAPTASTDGKLLFTGGTVDFYELPAGTPVQGHGGISGDISFIQTNGTLWLSLAAAPNDILGNTLSSTIPSGETLTSFIGGQGQGPLDVIGGPAAPFLDTCTFFNPFDLPRQCSDMTFTTDFSTSSTTGGDFAVNGSATLKANAIPEPVSLSLLGFGMVALGLARRRKH